MSTSDSAVVAAFLRDGSPAPVEDLRAWNLGGTAYLGLPEEHPDRERLRPDFLALLGRHHSMRAEVAQLVAAWREAGIEAMLFKGFHMAEWIYPTPGARFHGDADVLVREEEAARAMEVAEAEGWMPAYDSAATGRPYFHGVASLARPGGAAWVDLHRSPLHRRLRWSRRQNAIRDAVWAAAEEIEWMGARLRIPRPVDAALLLCLQRGWGEEWGVKPHDYEDLRLLGERHDVDRETLLRRAAEVGAERSVRLFLDRCDPWRRRLVIGVPPRAVVRHNLRLTRRERPRLQSRRWLMRLIAAPTALRQVAAMLPHIFAVRRALRRYAALPALLTAVTPRPRPSGACSSNSYRVARGTRLAIRLLRLDPAGSCVTRALTVYRALRAHGDDAVFVTGVAREGRDLSGHAWVEVDGQVVPGLAEPHNRHRYEVSFVYPGQGAGAAVPKAEAT